ncbi:MAG: cytochrome c oxidase subunit 3 [Cytophagales bacterium]
MSVTVQSIENSTVSLSKRMILWIFIITIVMLFGAWTSAYIVSKAEGRWMEFPMPNMMFFSTLALLASSLPMHLAYKSAKENNLERIKIMLFLTLFLAVVFIVLQLESFKELISNQIYFTGKQSNVSSQYLYSLTFFHALHIVAGIVFLLTTLYKSIVKKIHSGNTLTIELCATFWHFLDGLWLFLYIFLYFNR